MNNFDEHKNLSKFEKQFLNELLNDIEKREDSSWAKTWEYMETQNAFTGHKYSGMNEVFLELVSRINKFDDPRFATFNQAKENSYHIEKGSSGIPIQFFTFINKETNKPWNEKEFQKKTKNMTPQEKIIEQDKKQAIAKVFHVFNAKNVISNKNKLSLSENKPMEKFNKKINTNVLINEFEKNLIDGMEVGFQEIHSQGAFYTPSLDKVTMPLKEQFNSYEERMAVLLHELGHATGNEKRLSRKLDTNFGSTNYSKEEVKVEMNSVFMVNQLGLDISPEQKENHLLYLDGWGKHIKNEPKEFLYALNDSLKIKDYMIEKGKFNDLFLEKEIELGIDIDTESFKKFATAFNEYSNTEFGNEFTQEETEKSIIEEEKFICPIAYTDVFDYTETIEFEKQVAYDLINEKEISNLNSEYLSLEGIQNISIESYIDNLSNGDFDGFISDESMNIDRDEISNLIKLATYTNNTSYIEQYAKENNLEVLHLDIGAALLNKNHILKTIDDDTVSFFNKNGVNLSEEFLHDKDFKPLVSFQLSHYESVKEVGIDDNYNLLYTADVEQEDKIVAYSNYKDLWEKNFKNDFIEDFNNFTYEELEQDKELSKVPNLLNKLSKNYPIINKAVTHAKEYGKPIKEKDLDNDGVPDRIDIDDTRNSVQTTADLNKVGNRTDKHENNEKEKKIQKNRSMTR